MSIAERLLGAPESPRLADLPQVQGDLDRAIDIVSNHRRRRAITAVHADGPTTLGELSERLAAAENDTPRAALTARERKRVYVCLYQSHLPRLDDVDAIDFEKSRGTIRPGSQLSGYAGLVRAVEAIVTGGGDADAQ